MSKIVQIKIFNNILDNFLTFIEQDFPFLKSKMMLTRNSVEFVRKANPRMVIEQFMNYAYKYKTKIFDCDEDFFIKEYDIQNINQDDFMSSINLKELWMSGQITNVQKAKIFLFFQQLYLSGEKCYI